MTTYSLASVGKGQKATVWRILTQGSMRRRLQDMGLIEGTEVECLHESPAGEFAAYFIRGAVIALRSEDTDRILVIPA